MKDRNWTEFTQAEWLLEMRIARYAELVSMETKLEKPDQEKVNEWLKNQAAAADMLDQVSFLNAEKVTELLDKLKDEKDETGI